MLLMRTLLFVPANRENMVERAHGAAAAVSTGRWGSPRRAL